MNECLKNRIVYSPKEISEDFEKLDIYKQYIYYFCFFK